ncbi:hypothetical protein THAOC_12691, partial [Thalassiosira oceanica]
MAPLGRGELLLNHEPPSNGGWQHRNRRLLLAFYRNAVINGSGTSAGRARLTMSEFAVAPARLIDNGGRRAIGIALRPQHFIGDVLGMNRCHGRRHRATRGGHGGARLSLSSLLSRCAGRADGVL